MILKLSILDVNAVIETMIGRDPVGKHECLSCGKIFDTKQRVKRHAELHLDMKVPCSICNKTFKTRNALSQHYDTAHKDQIVAPWSM